MIPHFACVISGRASERTKIKIYAVFLAFPIPRFQQIVFGKHRSGRPPSPASSRLFSCGVGLVEPGKYEDDERGPSVLLRSHELTNEASCTLVERLPIDAERHRGLDSQD